MLLPVNGMILLLFGMYELCLVLYGRGLFLLVSIGASWRVRATPRLGRGEKENHRARLDAR